jgi:hypothetical protein
MQDAKILSQKDITRLNKAIERLQAIGQRLLNNGAGEEEVPVKRRRRRRRKAAEADAVVDTDN